jgi:hypothetical protein
MEKFTEALRNFGALVLSGTDNNPDKAADGLNQLNKILSENEGLVNFLLDPKTQKQIKAFAKMKLF